MRLDDGEAAALIHHYKEQLQSITQAFKRELRVYQLVLKDPRTPRLAQICLGLAVGYALLPFDLIPDFIPVIGHLDDAILVPGLVLLALKLIPAEIVAECRHKAAAPLDRP